jgi:hypothetical protein
MLDPDPHSINPDPQTWLQLTIQLLDSGQLYKKYMKFCSLVVALKNITVRHRPDKGRKKFNLQQNTSSQKISYICTGTYLSN